MITFKKEHFIDKGDVIKFIAPEDDELYSPHIRNGDIFHVEKTTRVTYKTGFILSPSDSIHLDFSNQTQLSLKLYPTQPDTLYQISVGIRGGENILFYPIIPIGQYIYRLEESTMYTNPTDPNKMWIGAFTREDTPSKDPQLMLYFVKDFEPFYMQFVNYSSDYDKICIDFIINKCQIKKISNYKGKVIEIKKYNMID